PRAPGGSDGNGGGSAPRRGPAAGLVLVLASAGARTTPLALEGTDPGPPRARRGTGGDAGPARRRLRGARSRGSRPRARHHGVPTHRRLLRRDGIDRAGRARPRTGPATAGRAARGMA